MWQAERKQRSFAEQSIVGGSGRNAQLVRIDGLIQWGAIERELEPVHAAQE